MLTEKQAIEIFEWCGALNRDGHFAYTSGKHGKEYVNKDAVYPHTELISQLCESLAENYFRDEVDVVLGPALGGIILSQWTASHLQRLSGEECLATYAEKTTDGNFVLRRGYDELIGGQRVLIVEDVLTTGGSVKKIVALAKEHGAHVVGVAALVNRGNVKAQDIDAKLISLIQLSFESWDPKACPLCRENVPLNPSLGRMQRVK